METILATVTLISLALAACMGVLLARLVREERRRSDARVALLTALAASETPVGEPADVRRPPTKRVKTDRRPAISPAPEPVLEALEDFSFREPAEGRATNPVGTLFAEEDARSAWPFRVVAAAAVLAIISGLAFGMRSLSDPELPATEEHVTAGDARPPLELLSLAHRQQDGDLTISGLVQNPRGATALSRVEATVLALDAKGEQIASGRAPVDFSTLSPGEESPFIVRVRATNVARYRVSFKGEGDQPLAHVDRRNLDSLARKEVP